MSVNHGAYTMTIRIELCTFYYRRVLL